MMRSVVAKTARVSLAILVSMLVLFTGLTDARAHTGDESYLYLDIGEELRARLQMPFPDIETVLGISLDVEDDDLLDQIAANADAFRAYAADHVELGSNGVEWELVPTDVTQVEDINYVEVLFDVDIGDGPVPEEISVTLDPFMDEIEGRNALMLTGNDWKRGIVDSEADDLVRLTPDSRSATVNLGESSQWKNLRASIALGVDHIRTGPDHMLFVVALLLPAVLVWQTAWKPAEGFVSTLWRLTKILTMFTLAHSVTFTLAGIGAVPTPGPKVTETIIALSIAATALHNLRPIIVNREWIIALVFGLFHGFGFASLVQDLDVSRATELVSLAGRNIGIEIGQVFVVLLTFPALFLLRRTRVYRPFFVGGSIALIIVSIGWAIERLFGGPEVTSNVIDKIAKFPRVLIFIAIGTAIAAGLYFYERSRDRLLDTASRGTSAL